MHGFDPTAALLALTITSLALWLLQPVAQRLNLLDHPVGRKDHAHPTPVTGGLAILVGCIVAFFAVMSPVLIYQAVRYRKYIGSLPQRLGYLPVSFNLDADESIWIHAVSLGETRAAAILIDALRKDNPKLRL